MARKTLILNGSPRPAGNTATLIAELKRHLDGEVIELSAYRSSIAPCVDCRGCWKTARCVVRDEMQTIYDDDFDNVVIASPVYFGTVTGNMLNVFSRMQPSHAARFFIGKPLVKKPKKAGVILTAGGKGNFDMAHHHLRAFFRMVNAQGYEDHLVVTAKTDEIPAGEDAQAMHAARNLAAWLNEDE